MSKRKSYQNNLNFLFLVSLSILVLLLSVFNLQNFGKKTKNIVTVLGTETDNLFWEDFVNKHPTYIEAWIELNRMDKVSEIDPNYYPKP